MLTAKKMKYIGRDYATKAVNVTVKCIGSSTPGTVTAALVVCPRCGEWAYQKQPPRTDAKIPAIRRR